MKWKRRALEWKEGREERRGEVFHSAFLFPPVQAMRPSNCPSVCLSQSCTELKRCWTVLWPPNRFELQHSRLLTTNNTTDFQRFHLQQASNTTWVQKFLASWLLVAFYYALQGSTTRAQQLLRWAIVPEQSGPKGGAGSADPISVGKLGPHLTQCRLRQGIPPCQVTS